MSTLVKKTTATPSPRLAPKDSRNGDMFFIAPFINGELLPSVNICDKKDRYELEVAAPGYKKSDFKITAINDMLTISAETSSEKTKKKNHYLRREFTRSSFARSFRLPEDAEQDKIRAKYENGLVKIELKKSAQAMAAKKEIKIN